MIIPVNRANKIDDRLYNRIKEVSEGYTLYNERHEKSPTESSLT